MFKLSISSEAAFEVRSRSKSFHFASDGSAPNPLETVYASLAACAGVYAVSACKSLGVPWAGIEAELVPKSGAAAFPPKAFEIHLAFPDGFPADAKGAVLESVGRCAVKQLILAGGSIEFSVSERPAA